MNVAPEQLELIDDLRSTVRAVLDRTEPGDAKSWPELVEQVGVAGLLVPESLGGLGLGAHELTAVAEEIGAAAVQVPFLSHAVGSAALLRHLTSGDLVDELLTDLVSGARRIALALGGEVAVAGTQATGTAPVVVDAPGADLLLVESVLDGEPAIVLVRTGDPGVTVTERSALDLSRSIGTVMLADAPATVLVVGEAARHAVTAALHWSRLALAADQVGLARRSLAVTVEYAGIRTQFGAVIGSFQAVKHRCTEVLLEVELAAALVEQAASALDAQDDPQDLVSTAALQAGTAALVATEAAIALHGGIGFTWEHVAHHYFRRARSNVSLLGPVQELRDAVAASAGL